VPVLGAAVSLKNGLLLSAAMILTVLILNLLMYPLSRAVPEKFQLAVSFLMSGAAVTPVCILANYFAPSSSALCGVYLPLISVCAIPMIEKKYYGAKYGLVMTALSALLNGAGFALAAVIFSILREILGNGTLYERPVPGLSQIKFSFALLPAGAFIILGLIAAFFRKLYGTADDNGEDMK
jgi:electron transport complex protein RnfE